MRQRKQPDEDRARGGKGRKRPDGRTWHDIDRSKPHLLPAIDDL